MMPVVSIIICTCNRAEHLRQTLAAMASIYVPQSMPTELIVVDNASTDDTAEVARQCQMPNMPVRYVHEPRRGQCYARNTGIAAAQGQVFLFTDDDVRPPKNWIKGMCGPILSGKAQAAAGSITMAPHLRRPWMKPQHHAWLLEYDFSKVEFPHVMIGANMAFSRAVIEKVPEFDTELGPGALGFSDDLLFSLQVETAGFPIVGTDDATVVHHFDPSRLQRSDLLSRAEKEGRVAAYLSHHWLHGTMRFSILRLLKHRIELSIWRFFHPRLCALTEGCTEAELQLVHDVHFQEQYKIEAARPRNYDKRGLVKLPSL
jgi:glycosyltransferase involved in cell wall biosynthesis